MVIITFNNSTVFSFNFFRNTKINTHQTPSCLVCSEFKSANIDYPRFSSKFNAFAEFFFYPVVGVINKPDIPKLFIRVYGDVWESGCFLRILFATQVFLLLHYRDVQESWWFAELFQLIYILQPQGNQEISVLCGLLLLQKGLLEWDLCSGSSWKLHIAAELIF